MKSMSRAALAAALVAGMGGVAITPVIAKEKKEEKAAGIKLSPAIQKQAVAAQTALTAKDYATAEPLVIQVEAGAVTVDDKYIAAAFRYMLEGGKMNAPGGVVDDTKLKAPLDALIANPKTPATDLPRFNYIRGVIALNAKIYPEALSFFQRAQQLGFVEPNLALQITKIKMETGDIAGGSAELEKAIAAQTATGAKADESLYRYALSKTMQRKMGAETTAWIKRYLAAYPTTKNWRDMVFIYGMQSNSAVTLDKGQRVDLFRLLRANKALADQLDYEIYAQYMIDLGIPYEAKKVIEEGRASGKIPTTSPNANDLFKAASQSISNEPSLAPLESKAAASPNGKLAAGTADAYLGSGNYAKAAELYRLALQKGGVDADLVNTHLGIALANAGDKAGAKTAFATVTTAPRADIAALWTVSLDTPVVG